MDLCTSDHHVAISQPCYGPLTLELGRPETLAAAAVDVAAFIKLEPEHAQSRVLAAAVASRQAVNFSHSSREQQAALAEACVEQLLAASEARPNDPAYLIRLAAAHRANHDSQVSMTVEVAATCRSLPRVALSLSHNRTQH